MHHLFPQPYSLTGTEVSLESLLEAREQRAFLQQKCLEDYQQTVLSLTLLAVGGVKKNALLDVIFAKALQNLTALFTQLKIQPTVEFIRPLETGHEAIFVLPIDAVELKRATIALEDSSPLARLWDIDVIDSAGHLLSRTELDCPPRPCLLCSQDAKSCARSRKHSVAEILAEMQSRVQASEFAEQIANLIYQALLKEARLSPKPGLVDSLNNGAHSDMNLATFEQSALALRPFWGQFVLEGMLTANLPTSQILAKIRPLGVKAEQAMFAATQNVNTHKGAIFAFGLIATAVGRLVQQGIQEKRGASRLTIAEICQTVADFTQGLTQELANYPEHFPLTAGVQLYREFGLTGARGEAENGFTLVQEVLQNLELYQSISEPHRLQIALLLLMGKNPDTNVVHRAGMAGLTLVQTEANKRLKNAKLLQNPTALTESLHTFDEACIAQNISCGGSADLLALTIFFLSLSTL